MIHFNICLYFFFALSLFLETVGHRRRHWVQLRFPQSTTAAGCGIHGNALKSPIIVRDDTHPHHLLYLLLLLPPLSSTEGSLLQTLPSEQHF